MQDYSAFLSRVQRELPGLLISQNEPLRSHTSFKIGGNAKLFARPKDERELAALIGTAKVSGLRIIVLGCGSNLLFADHDIEALVINTSSMTDISAEGSEIKALAGLPLPALAVQAMRLGLSGLDFAQGIPGSVGGAVCMNAGAYGFDISMVCSEVRCISFDTLVSSTFAAKELDFGYRRSVFSSRPELILTSAVFSLEPDDPDAIRAKMNDFAARRAASQPLDYPSAGSVFKRPEGYFAGKLIEDCGLKGLSVGGACVSPKHAGFIINTGSATCVDVLRLIEKVQEKVYCQYGVELECEIKFVE